MPNPSATPTPITPPRVPLIDQRTGLIDRSWYMFFVSMFNAATAVVDDVVGPDAASLVASYDAALRALADDVNTQPPAIDYSAEIADLRKEKDLNPSSETGELQAQINDVRQELELLPRQELGTFAALQQANLPWTTFDTTPQSVPTDVGTAAWDGGTTLGLQMTANVLQKIGEDYFFYIKASSAITKGDLIMFTGAVGASGVVTGAPATGVTNGQSIMGLAAESIALNGFGLVQAFGVLRGITTTGASVGESWADGDILYYNSAYTGGLTKTFPATGPIVTVAAVVNAGSGGSGSLQVRVSVTQRITGTSPVSSSQTSAGSTISLASGYGDTQNPYAAKTANYVLAGPTSGSAAVPTFRALVAADIPALPYGTGTVTSVSVTSGNGFAGTVATATTTPAITISTSITGLLYGNGTAIAAATISAPLSYSAGTLSIPAANGSTNGYLTSTDWTTFNNKQPAGTYVTSVTGTSPVASSGGTTPAISLASGYGDTQNPYASKTANYVLAAPNGSSGAPTFRALVAADIPALPYQTAVAPVTYTANFSVATTDAWIINNKSGSSCTATLPAAASYTGRVLHFQNYQAQTLVSASSNVVPLAGGAAGTSILLASSGDSATLVSDGSNWVMTQYVPNNILLLE
jgi:hypothetical protein